MNKKYQVYQVDSFTREKFLGNPAGVVINADGLNYQQMQRIARELNNSETAFIFSSTSDDYDMYIRYFTPTSEVPICGHATIAAHYAYAVKHNLESTVVRQKSGAGTLPVEINKNNSRYEITMTQGLIEFGDYILNEYRNTLLSALGLTECNLLRSHPIQIVSTGHSKVMIGIKSAEILNNIQPNFDDLSALSKLINCNGYYVFTQGSSCDDVLINGRMFAPAIGINEDPVTGNANGPLGAYLVHHNLINHDGKCLRFKATQGEKMNRKGSIDVHVEIKNDKPSLVKITGEAVIVFETIIEI